MAKITLTDISNPSNGNSISTAVNDNNTIIENAITNTLSRDGTSPNEMNAVLDMNSNHIINLPAPTSDTEPVRVQDIEAVQDYVELTALVADAAASAADAQASEDASADILADMTALAASVGSPVTKTTAYTITNADKYKTFLLGGNAMFTVSSDAVGSMDSDFFVVLNNTDVYTGPGSGRGKLIAFAGIASFWLWPGQTVTIRKIGATYVKFGPGRWKVPQGQLVTFYCNPAGSDSNDGLNTGTSNAMALPSVALFRIHDYLDLNSGVTTGAKIKMEDGTYNDHIHYAGTVPGAEGNAKIVLEGNLGTPQNTIFNTVGTQGIGVFDRGILKVTNFKIQTSGASGNGAAFISGLQGNLIIGTGIEFGDCDGPMLQCTSQGLIQADGAYFWVNGNASAFAQTQTQGQITGIGSTVAFQKNVTFSTGTIFASDLSFQSWNLATFNTGGFTVTGTRYGVFGNSAVSTGGGGSSFFPGTVAGSTGTGGLYS